MKMPLSFIRSLSRTQTDHVPDDDGTDDAEGADVCTSLTVWRKSLILNCNGFTVINSDGNLIYRVDNYTGRPPEVVLMDASGEPLLSLRRRKKLGLMDKNWWAVYEGEVGEFCSKKPIWRVRKHVNYLLNPINGGNSNSGGGVLAHIYFGPSTASEKGYAYVIEGSYAVRSCRVLDRSRRLVAEVRRKESAHGGAGISFGADVFVLMVHPGFDTGFAMAVVLILDEMFS
ncbi:protein LURP-one-related 17 [Malania oleifera]|uniref:protein LURP-one-related 17 n=1 Tax=Malania oleifera TaxID=397392 RepID=UPI0025AE3DA6|nr:protein LURP-one-related 17 [Malania oleifera]